MSTKESARLHPKLNEIFKAAESRFFTDEELAVILQFFPHLAPHTEVALELRAKDMAIVTRVVKEIFSQYPYEKFHEFSTTKCVRDVRYVLAYCTQAMLAEDSRWFEDKLLIWLKTILHSFDFPDPIKLSSVTLFSDPVLETKLKELPKKIKSIFHTYYRLKQEVGKELKAEQFKLIAPYLDLVINVLSEK
jgi:hypothetical protein